MKTMIAVIYLIHLYYNLGCLFACVLCDNITVAEIFNAAWRKSVFTVNQPVVDERRDVAFVRFTNKARISFSECNCCFIQFVVWNFREQMVDLVSTNVVDKIVNHKTIRTINRRQISFDVCPLSIAVPRCVNILMMQECC